MTQLDGAFSSIDFIQSMKIERLENESFSHLINVIQQITPEELRRLAVEYLQPDDLVTIVVR